MSVSVSIQRITAQVSNDSSNVQPLHSLYSCFLIYMSRRMSDCNTNNLPGDTSPWCKIIRATMTSTQDRSLTIGSATAYLIDSWAKMSKAGIADTRALSTTKFMCLKDETSEFRAKYCANRFLLIDKLIIELARRGRGYGRSMLNLFFLSLFTETLI